MLSKPVVSVLVPAYNYGHYLDEAIQSVLAQTFTDFELVIVDNCSPDNTKEVVGKYLHDGRIRFYTNKKNLGAVGNFNKCLGYAQGRYLKFLCADDKFAPELLEKFVAVMDDFPAVALVSCYVTAFGLKSAIRKPPYSGFIAAENAVQSLVSPGVKNWLFAPTAVMFRREALTLGGFNTDLLNLIDLEFYIRVLTLGDCYIIPEPLAYIRTHEGMQTVLLKKKKYDRIFERYRFMQLVAVQTAVHFPKAVPLVNDHLKKRATRCAAIMYQLLPQLYKKQNRLLFKKAFRIGASSGVLFGPASYLFQNKYRTKLLTKKATPANAAEVVQH